MHRCTPASATLRSRSSLLRAAAILLGVAGLAAPPAAAVHFRNDNYNTGVHHFFPSSGAPLPVTRRVDAKPGCVTFLSGFASGTGSGTDAVFQQQADSTFAPALTSGDVFVDGTGATRTIAAIEDARCGPDGQILAVVNDGSSDAVVFFDGTQTRALDPGAAGASIDELAVAGNFLAYRSRDATGLRQFVLAEWLASAGWSTPSSVAVEGGVVDGIPLATLPWERSALNSAGVMVMRVDQDSGDPALPDLPFMLRNRRLAAADFANYIHGRGTPIPTGESLDRVGLQSALNPSGISGYTGRLRLGGTTTSANDELLIAGPGDGSFLQVFREGPVFLRGFTTPVFGPLSGVFTDGFVAEKRVWKFDLLSTLPPQEVIRVGDATPEGDTVEGISVSVSVNAQDDFLLQAGFLVDGVPQTWILDVDHDTLDVAPRLKEGQEVDGGVIDSIPTGAGVWPSSGPDDGSSSIFLDDGVSWHAVVYTDASGVPGVALIRVSEQGDVGEPCDGDNLDCEGTCVDGSCVDPPDVLDDCDDDQDCDADLSGDRVCGDEGLCYLAPGELCTDGAFCEFGCGDPPPGTFDRICEEEDAGGCQQHLDCPDPGFPVCDDSDNTCRRDVGAACSLDSECVFGCDDDGFCDHPPGLRDACELDTDCDDDLVCQSGGTFADSCAAPLGDGCSNNYQCDNLTTCIDNQCTDPNLASGACDDIFDCPLAGDDCLGGVCTLVGISATRCEVDPEDKYFKVGAPIDCEIKIITSAFEVPAVQVSGTDGRTEIMTTATADTDGTLGCTLPGDFDAGSLYLQAHWTPPDGVAVCKPKTVVVTDMNDATQALLELETELEQILEATQGGEDDPDTTIPLDTTALEETLEFLAHVADLLQDPSTMGPGEPGRLRGRANKLASQLSRSGVLGFEDEHLLDDLRDVVERAITVLE